MKIFFWILLICFLAFETGVSAFAAQDPWLKLQKKFMTGNKPPASSCSVHADDPWIKLREVFLPFSREEEIKAATDIRAAKSVALKINHQLDDYETFIATAAFTFNVPEVIIKSVIMAESGGNPVAKAKTSSAKGLMQTINATFRMARNDLKKRKIIIPCDPFDPRASIMAGTWYLDRMYKKALADKKIKNNERKNIVSWRFPLEYYYAGPVCGAKVKNKILIFSKGTQKVIDKRGYSKKIMTWAKIIERS